MVVVSDFYRLIRMPTTGAMIAKRKKKSFVGSCCLHTHPHPHHFWYTAHLTDSEIFWRALWELFLGAALVTIFSGFDRIENRILIVDLPSPNHCHHDRTYGLYDQCVCRQNQ